MTQVRLHRLKPGEILAGRYEVLSPLGEGGMGWVYLGMQLELDRKVAIKTLHPGKTQSPNTVARFRREASVAQALTHPNTVRIYDFGKTDYGMLYLVMEYLKGSSLDEVIRAQGKLPEHKVIRVAEQALKSLIEAHAFGIVHRDIKPSNLMICKQVGVPYFIKVLDFGIARISDSESSFMTDTGALMGTPHYMSPEQARGEQPDARSDLYSLGVTLLELATGKPPFDGGSPLQVALQHLTPDPIPIPKWLLKTELGRVIQRAVEKSLDKRYRSAEEMLYDLTGETVQESQPHPAVVGTETIPGTLPDLTHPDQDDDEVWSTEELAVGGKSEVGTDSAWHPGAEASSKWRRRFVVGGVAGVLVGAAVAMALVLTGAEGVPQNDEPTQDSAANSTVDNTSNNTAENVVIEEESSEAAVPTQTVAAVESMEVIDSMIVALESTKTHVGAAIDAADQQLAVVSASLVRLEIVTDPAGAFVSLNDTNVCTTPCNEVLPRLDEMATVTIELPNYEIVEQTADLSQELFALALELVPEEDEEEDDDQEDDSEQSREEDDDEEPDLEEVEVAAGSDETDETAETEVIEGTETDEPGGSLEEPDDDSDPTRAAPTDW